MANDVSAILDRIDDRLNKVGLTAKAASIAAGLSPHCITGIRKQWRRGLQHSVGQPVLIALARPLRTTPNWLLAGMGQEEADTHADLIEPAEAPEEKKVIHLPAVATQTAKPTRPTMPPQRPEPAEPETVPLRGEVAPGHWIDQRVRHNGGRVVTVPPDPRFTKCEQFAFLMKGRSIDNIARDGDYLIAVPPKFHEPQHGDVVIASRHRDHTREVIARRFLRAGNEIELHTDSNDPHCDPREELCAPIKYKPKSGVAIDGVVVSIYRPVVQK